MYILMFTFLDFKGSRLGTY